MPRIKKKHSYITRIFSRRRKSGKEIFMFEVKTKEGRKIISMKTSCPKKAAIIGSLFLLHVNRTGELPRVTKCRADTL